MFSSLLFRLLDDLVCVCVTVTVLLNSLFIHCRDRLVWYRYYFQKRYIGLLDFYMQTSMPIDTIDAAFEKHIWCFFLHTKERVIILTADSAQTYISGINLDEQIGERERLHINKTSLNSELNVRVLDQADWSFNGIRFSNLTHTLDTCVLKLNHFGCLYKHCLINII